MYCPDCNDCIEDPGAGFCEHCGRPIDEAESDSGQ